MQGSRRHIFSGAVVEEVSGFARAVIVGDQVFVSSTPGVDQETGNLAKGIAAQTEQALNGIEAALKEADSGLHDVVRVRTILRHRRDLEAMTEVLKDRVGMYYPARTTMFAALSTDEALVEIEVDAMIGSGTPFD